MNDHDIILISGKQGSGKTTTASEIEFQLEKLGNYQVVQLAFAQIIYEMHDAVRDIGVHYGIEKVEPKDGKLLQLLGTEWGRSMDKDIWVKAIQHNVNYYLTRFSGDKSIVFIISDCRFENEITSFRNALTVRLQCPSGARQERCSQWRENEEHPSEIALDEWETKGCFDLTFDSFRVPAKDIAGTIIRNLK